MIRKWLRRLFLLAVFMLLLVPVCANAAGKVTITRQPKSVKVFSGETAEVTVEAEGDGLKYAWYYKNPGASGYTKTSSFNGNSYSVTMSSSRDGRYVYCKVTDKYGNTVKTNTVSLRMAKTAKITQQPKSVSVTKGKTAKVTVKATGDGLKYTWYYKDAGASSYSVTSSFKGNSYSVSMTNARHGRKVYCVITDQYGNSVQSNTVTLRMTGGVKISTQPVSVNAAYGDTAKVTVKATGDGLKYAWYFKDADATSFVKTSSFKGSSYSVTMNELRDGRQIYCKVSDKYGNAQKTDIVTLKMSTNLSYFTWREVSGGMELVSYDADAAKVIIPSKVNGKKVVSIGSDAFKYCQLLSEVDIPLGVTSIGYEAFYYCTNLRGVVIPDGVTEILDFAFAECSKLRSVELPDSVTDIGMSAFNSCESLLSIEIPDSVTYMDEAVLAYCTNLSSVKLPAKLTSIPSSMFVDCTSLRSIAIPDSVDYIGSCAFMGCSALEEINIPNGVQYIGFCTFDGCGSLENIDLPGSVISIGDFAFSECTSLMRIYIPGSVKTIADSAFDGCTKLNVVCPAGSFAQTWCMSNGIRYITQ